MQCFVEFSKSESSTDQSRFLCVCGGEGEGYNLLVFLSPSPYDRPGPARTDEFYLEFAPHGVR